MTICSLCGEEILEMKREHVEGCVPGQRKRWRHYPECPATGSKPAPAEPGPPLYPIWSAAKVEPASITMDHMYRAAKGLGEAGGSISDPNDMYRILVAANLHHCSHKGCENPREPAKGYCKAHLQPKAFDPSLCTPERMKAIIEERDRASQLLYDAYRVAEAMVPLQDLVAEQRKAIKTLETRIRTLLHEIDRLRGGEPMK